MKRVIWIIPDSFGIGALPDAGSFGDEGADTFGHIWEYNNGINIPNLTKLGLCNIDGVKHGIKSEKPAGAYGRCMEKSQGKDTTAGHWEMTGIISEKAFPVFPEGFPEEIIVKFTVENEIDGVLGNCVASGTEILKTYGRKAFEKDIPIVYTSADSVFQAAYHVGYRDNPEITDPDRLARLYKMCMSARRILTGKYEVARVIARPFTGTDGNYVRTSDRRDFAIAPPEDNLLNLLKNKGLQVTAIGKINDIFAGSGITEYIHTRDNMHGIDETLNYMDIQKTGLIFTNLVEFDSSWGHRRDAKGYGKGLEEFDSRLPEIFKKMQPEDVLIINADHGCDPVFKGTDHTREYIPVMMYGESIKSINFGTRDSFADIGQTITEILGTEHIKTGKGFYKEVSVYENV